MSTELKDLAFITLPEITPQQQQAIELLCAGIKQNEIARQLDIAPETISRWKLDADFLAALNGARLARWDATRARLDALADMALDTLEKLFQHRDAKIKIAALKIYFSTYAAGSIPTGHLNVEKVKLQLESQHRVTDNDRFLHSALG